MRGSVLARARFLSLHADSGISEEEKRKWIPVRLQKAKAEHFSADDVRLMREMYEAGYPTPYIGRVFGFGARKVHAICTGSLFKRVISGQGGREKTWPS
jgi:hypothetical protein